MGFLKKITRPISKVLDKIVPNEIKPALPFLAAAAPFMAPGIMGAFGNTMLSRALISGGLNLGSQLAQEGSEGEFSPLSVALASGIGALTTPGSPGKAIGVDKPVAGFDSPVYASGTGTPSAAQFLEGKAAGMEPGFIKSGLEGLATGSEKLIGLSEGLATDGILSKAGAKALTIPAIQGTTDLAVAEGRRLEKQAAIDEALAAAEGLADDADRALAIRQFMEAAGYFSEDEIVDTITAAGYADGGRVGLKGGGMDAGQMYITEPGIMGNPAVMEKIEDMREFMIANPDIVDITDYSEKYKDKDDSEEVDFKGIEAALEGVDEDEKSEFLKKLIKFRDSLLDVPEMAKGGLMNLGGKEMDLRGGGFVPIGKKERADDVPARLSKNEFVMTADAVRGAGGGDINKGAKRMYETMNRLEARA
jgi:hypothetical protein